MATDVDIDELLRQDEAELRAKKKRLKAFATSLDEVRSSTAKAAAAAADVVDRGDLSRADFAKVFALTKGERASLFPASPRRGGTAAGDDAGEGADAADAPTDEHSNGPADAS